jgi:hypothetical protein
MSVCVSTFLHTTLASVRFLFFVLFAFSVTTCAGQASPRAAVPVDPVTAILDAFDAYQIVALGEGNHGNLQGHAFRLALIQHPRFAETVNDIVVEFGNARFQPLMDRFVGGDEVPPASLRRIWQDTTQPFTTWDSPIYEELFQAVRTVNSNRAPDRQLRVLLGDPPIDWNVIQDAEQARQWLESRDTYPAELIKREVLSRNRRALVIYGDMHFQRKNIDLNYADHDGPEGKTIVNLLETTTKVFSVWTNTHTDLATLQPNVIAWRKPSLVQIRGTTLGAADFGTYYPMQGDRFIVRGDKTAPVPRDQWRSLRMEDQVDAVLYLGSPSEISYATLSPDLCADTAYVAMRLRRLALSGLPADRLEECPAPERK